MTDHTTRSRMRFVAAAMLATMTTAAVAQESPVIVRDQNASDRPIRATRGVLHEGAFLADRPGRMVPLERGGSAFLFDRDERGRAAPPMALLPCTTLMRMEQIREARPDDVRFLVSGQVFVHDGRNYLLPTHYKVRTGDLADEPATPEVIEDDPSEDPDPSVDELIGAIESLTPPAREGEADAVTLPRGDLMTDGSFLKPRLGRIVRGAGGALAFAINNDVDASVAPDAPLVLLPSLSLMEIERLIEIRGENQAFILSGRVFLYRGVNYLLPSMVQLQLDNASGLTSAQ